MPQSLAAVYAVGTRSLRALYPLVSADAPTTLIDVAMAGTWEGHPSGPFTFDRDVFSQIVANFERNPNPLPLDYEHSTEYAIPAPACGWVQRLEVRDESGVPHLYALVELTDEAAQFIREGRYRFSSGVFDFESLDPQTGESVGPEMLSLALTNMPFIRGQSPIRLSRRAAPTKGVSMSAVNKAELISHLRKLQAEDVTADQVQKLAAALGLLAEATSLTPEQPLADKKPEDAPAAEAPATPAPEDEKKKAPMSASGPPEASPAPPVTAAAPPAAEAEVPASPDAAALLEQVMAETGLDMSALMEALKGMLGGGAQPPAAQPALAASLSARDLTIRTLSDSLSAATSELKVYREREADDAVDLLVTTGRILDDGRAEWRKLYLSARQTFDSLSAKLPETVPLGAHATSQVPPTKDTPAIDESDPEVQRLRRSVSQTRLSAPQRDEYVRKCLAQRKSAPAQA